MLLDFTDDQSTLVLVIAITWANVDPDLFRHIASLGHNELITSPCPTDLAIYWQKTVATFTLYKDACYDIALITVFLGKHL